MSFTGPRARAHRGPAGADDLFIIANAGIRHIDCTDAAPPYYARLVAHVRERTEPAMAQSHCFKVMKIALVAKARIIYLGDLADTFV